MANALVQLDANGTPSSLNFNVPDAISYPARHYLGFTFPEHIFHTLYTDTTYFAFDGLAPPTRNADGTPVLFGTGASTSYNNAVLEVYHAMTSGFRCSVQPNVFNWTGPGTYGSAILKVRGAPYDKWFPDINPEATSLRYAFTSNDNLSYLANPNTPVILADGDGTTAYSGVYSVADNPTGSTAGLAPSLTSLTPMRVVDEAMAGRRLILYRDADDLLACTFVTVSTSVIEYKFYLVEDYQLSSFYGNYGAGRTIKTLSLLPGEKTTMSFKSYRHSSESIKDTSSVLDSYSKKSSEEFQNAVESETAQKASDTRHDEGYVEASVSGSYLGVSAKVSGGYKGGSNSAREQANKNVSKALQKHSAQASAKRDVKVEHSSDSTTESGEENGVERQIQNVNVGNTLNFVFRQMNQEHVSLWHLTGVKVGFGNGTYGSFRVVPLSQIDVLLRDYVSNPDGPFDPAHPDNPSPTFPTGFLATTAQPLPAGWLTRIAWVRSSLLTECANVFDYNGDVVSLIESVTANPPAAVTSLQSGFSAEVASLVSRATNGGTPASAINTSPTPAKPVTYVRFKHDFSRAAAVDPTSYPVSPNLAVSVPGVIVGANRNVLRTDGVLVEALLGQGNGLDTYSAGLQAQAVRAKQYQVDALTAQAALENTKQALVASKDQTTAALYAQMFPAPK